MNDFCRNILFRRHASDVDIRLLLCGIYRTAGVMATLAAGFHSGSRCIGPPWRSPAVVGPCVDERGRGRTHTYSTCLDRCILGSFHICVNRHECIHEDARSGAGGRRTDCCWMFRASRIAQLCMRFPWIPLAGHVVHGRCTK